MKGSLDRYIAHRLRLSLAKVSLVETALMALLSVAGLLWPRALYPTQAGLEGFPPNDVANLVVGIPLMLGSLWMTTRGRDGLAGLLLWPAAHMYIAYNYIVYFCSAGWPAPWSLGYLALIALAISTLLRMIWGLNRRTLARFLAGAVPERLVGGVLTGFGVVFSAQVLYSFSGALTKRLTIPATDVGLYVADGVFGLALLWGGVSLWRRRTLGYVLGLGLLAQVCAAFVGLIVVFVFEPVWTRKPFDMSVVVALLVIGLIGFVPLERALTGVKRRLSGEETH